MWESEKGRMGLDQASKAQVFSRTVSSVALTDRRVALEKEFSKKIPDSLIPRDSLEEANQSESMIWPLTRVLAGRNYSFAPIGSTDVTVVQRWMAFMKHKIETTPLTTPEDQIDDLEDVYYIVFHELCRQVMVSNFERGSFLLSLIDSWKELASVKARGKELRADSLQAKVIELERTIATQKSHIAKLTTKISGLEACQHEPLLQHQEQRRLSVAEKRIVARARRESTLKSISSLRQAAEEDGKLARTSLVSQSRSSLVGRTSMRRRRSSILDESTRAKLHQAHAEMTPEKNNNTNRHSSILGADQVHSGAQRKQLQQPQGVAEQSGSGGVPLFEKFFMSLQAELEPEGEDDISQQNDDLFFSLYAADDNHLRVHLLEEDLKATVDKVKSLETENQRLREDLLAAIRQAQTREVACQTTSWDHQNLQRLTRSGVDSQNHRPSVTGRPNNSTLRPVVNTTQNTAEGLTRDTDSNQVVARHQDSDTPALSEVSTSTLPPGRRIAAMMLSVHASKRFLKLTEQQMPSQKGKKKKVKEGYGRPGSPKHKGLSVAFAGVHPPGMSGGGGPPELDGVHVETHTKANVDASTFIQTNRALSVAKILKEKKDTPILSLKWTLRAIWQINQARLISENGGGQLSMREFVLDFYLRKYGLPSVAMRHVGTLVQNVFHYQYHPGVGIFFQFFENQLGPAMLKLYLTAIQLSRHGDGATLGVDISTSPGGSSSGGTGESGKRSDHKRAHEKATEKNVVFPEDEEGNPNWVALSRVQELVSALAPQLPEAIQLELFQSCVQLKQVGLREEWKSVSKHIQNLLEKTDRVDRDVVLHLFLTRVEQAERQVMAKLKSFFQDFDTLETGRLSYAEFTSCMRAIDPSFATNQVRELFKTALLHENNEGVYEEAVCEEAFVSACMEKRIGFPSF